MLTKCGVLFTSFVNSCNLACSHGVYKSVYPCKLTLLELWTICNILRRNWPSSWERLLAFSLSIELECSKDEERLCQVGSFAKTGWKQWHSGNGLWLANRPFALQMSLSSTTGHSTIELTGEGWSLFTFAAGMQEGRRLSWLWGKLR